MSEEKHEYLRIPKETEPPPSFRKSAAYKSFSEIVVDRFLKANVERAEILVPKDKDLSGTARGVGKILRKKGLSDKIACRISTDRKLWLFRRE